MLFQKLWDALQDGYFITFDSKKEMEEMLCECQNLDIRWDNGEKPLEFIPSSFVPAIDWGTHDGLYCQMLIHISDKCIQWRDIVSSCIMLGPPFVY